jgi:hypothetical protein
MSTEFITDPGIPLHALRGFNHHGVKSIDETQDSLVLTDGINSLMVCAESNDDAPCYIHKSGCGDPFSVLEAVADAFCVRVISEHDDEWHEIVEEINAGKKQTTKPSCPKCGAKRVAHIMYGLPHYCDELKADLETGRIVLGGCVVEGDSPTWHCNQCAHGW